jgi:hypothetical protein
MSPFLPIKASNGVIRYLAKRLKIDEVSLYEIFYARRGPTSLYRQQTRRKRSGAKRFLSVPQEPLRSVQKAVLKEVLSLAKVSSIAHGSVKDRNIVTNAILHCKSRSQISFDIYKAFDSVSLRRYYQNLRKSERTALKSELKIRGSKNLGALFCLIDTFRQGRYLKRPDEQAYAEEMRAFLQDERLVQLILRSNKLLKQRAVKRFLPQGAPTSPAAFNLICTIMDSRLEKLAKRVGGRVTRYVDNIDFSMDLDEIPQPVINAIRRIIKEAGFRINHRKTRHIKRGNRNGVPLRLPGINIIDHDLCLPPKKIRHLRAVLYYAGKDNDLATYHGIKGFVQMIYGGWPAQLRNEFNKGLAKRAREEGGDHTAG